jgi:hypothetical protein
MPELLTQPKRWEPRYKWPGINPSPGRLQVGMVADFMSEGWPASNRNTRPASVGIRTHGDERGKKTPTHCINCGYAIAFATGARVLSL